MKKSEQAKSLREMTPSYIIRSYFSMLLLMHKNRGALRIIAAYIFAIFAILSLWFTITVPITSDFIPPTWWEKMESRAISGFIMLANFFIYSMILSWRKGTIVTIVLRIALVGLVLYLDVFLIGCVAYVLIREGEFF